MKKKGTGLKYVPVEDFSLIPRYLLEQVKDKEWDDTDRLYAALCSVPPVFWKMNIVGVFADHDHMIKGFMWLVADTVSRKLDCRLLSVDPEYQNKGIIKEAADIARKIAKEVQAAGVTVSTSTPKAFEQYGFKATLKTNMELTL